MSINHSRHEISYIVHSTFWHICSGTILCTLHQKTGPPPCWGQFLDTLHIYSSWMPQWLQRPFRQVAFANLHYNKPTVVGHVVQVLVWDVKNSPVFSAFLDASKALQGWGTCGPREHLLWPASEFSLLILDYKITSKRITMISRCIVAYAT